MPSLAPRGAGGQHKERTETARGQASARPENPRAVLLAMPEGHPYRALAEGAYRPAHAADDERWELARRGAERILAADAPLAEDDRGYVASERNALCALCYWAARDGEEALCPDALLDEATIQRFVADDGPTRRASHRSRVALASSVRRFRRAFPELFPQRRRPSEADPELPPLEDWQFDAAWEETRGFRSAETRLNLRAMLLLGRGAGLDGAEMCFASGADVRHEPAAGTWVVVRRPGREREVPVLARYGPLLEDLAHARKERCLVADVPAPCNSSQPGQLARVLSRALARHGRGFKVSPEMLRKAWLVEHVAANVPVPSLLAAAGLGSLRTLERLLPYAPRPPSSKAHFAYELGGVENRQARRARRGE